jgi:diguanylate cyclase (GGDEF)-like protein
MLRLSLLARRTARFVSSLARGNARFDRRLGMSAHKGHVYARNRADEAVEQAICQLAHLMAENALTPSTREALDALRKAWRVARIGAQTDPLTQLPNRACFEQALEAAIERASQRRSRVILMFLDLDGFKEVNDRYGHQAGDLLLNTVAKRVVSSVRDRDLVARYGGDEFVVLLEDDAAPEVARHIAERIVEAVSTAYSIDGSAFSLSVSVGAALFPEHARCASELIQHADLAMYRAKRRRHSSAHYLVYDPSFEREGHSGVMAFADVLGAAAQVDTKKGQSGA